MLKLGVGGLYVAACNGIAGLFLATEWVAGALKITLTPSHPFYDLVRLAQLKALLGNTEIHPSNI